MSEPFWVPMGAVSSIDYEGAYNAATPYLPGDIVRYNGVDYMCVNPATGVDPPQVGAASIGTSLPGAPTDGTEFVLVDSLTAPTYAWRFKYMAAKATNKWVFVGGSSIFAEVATTEPVSVATYTALTTPGPSITLPVAGDYRVAVGFKNDGSLTNIARSWMSYDIGATPAVDADAASTVSLSATLPLNSSVMRVRKKLGLTAVALTAKYRCEVPATEQIAHRWMEVTPIAVGG